MPLAATPGAEIHYTVEGHGPDTLLLIAGLGQNSDEWGSAFVEALMARCRVVRLDNRGVPPSTNRSPSFTMRDMAKDAVAVLDAVGVARAHVMGWSMGGMIAQQMALDDPDRIERLVLLSSHFGGPGCAPMQPRAAPLFELPAPGTTAKAFLRAAFGLLTAPGFAERHPDLADRFTEQRLHHRVTKELFALQIQAVLASDRSHAVAGLKHPTLVVHGQSDPLVVVENGRMLAARIPNAKLVELPDCGHMPPLERPEQVLAAVWEFLDQR